MCREVSAYSFGRDHRQPSEIRASALVEDERGLHVFLWRGSQAIAVFGAALAMVGLASEVQDLGVTIPGTIIRKAQFRRRDSESVKRDSEFAELHNSCAVCRNLSPKTMIPSQKGHRHPCDFESNSTKTESRVAIATELESRVDLDRAPS